MTLSPAYLIGRLAASIATLVGISLVVFAMVALAPGDPLSGLIRHGELTSDIILELRRQYGLDEPLLERYLRWAGAYIRGDWGTSSNSRIEVQTLVAQRLPVTLAVMGTAYLLAAMIAVPVGILAATRRYSLFDQLATGLTLMGNAVPSFFMGLLLILVFSHQLKWLPTIYASTIDTAQPGWFWTVLQSAVMPIAVLALAEAAQLTRHVRAAMLEVVGLDHVTTARAKGLAEPTIVRRHCLRMALIPVITIVALQIPHLFTGAIVTEQIFSVPGIGSLLISSMLSKDTSVVMAVVFAFAILTVACNMLTDVLYGLLDPRIGRT
jgi:peptide/nickel transport system permease protein